ncbi:5-methyltetrahydropteroyltriglutamate--homocysteine methyltransferase-like [Eucalyptus grandis]|uniref:5-methyltetrahydropteroyltriglutamate-- homocysteine methyltransferase-like n=1 Tax=Eucalyptus grandis TaxID=71139 RepID=UPI00192EB375|nr:5-methyltetrahydropteroyltriglutamate--homocysteine methyltransferase-like [Eucalyptus grandis]
MVSRILPSPFIIPQIHTHTYYSQFSDFPLLIINKDADVVTIENCCSDESVFGEGVNYGAVIGLGVYDILSPRILSAEQIADSITKKLATNIVSFNPDYKFKTREHVGVKRALEDMVVAVELLCIELAHAMKEKSE